MNTSTLADRYFASMKSRDLEGLMTLFATDATMILPDGREFSDVTAIRAMYVGLFAMQPPVPTPIAMIAGAQGVATEIEAQLPNGTVRRTANFFHLDSAGLIKRLSVYARSG